MIYESAFRNSVKMLEFTQLLTQYKKYAYFMLTSQMESNSKRLNRIEKL